MNTMTTENSLENHFLIAMPSLRESLFEESVSVVCQHTTVGEIGLVINKAMPTTMREVFEQMGLPAHHLPNPEQLIMVGGPVQPEVGFVLHRPKGEWESTLKVSDQLHLTSSRDILEAISRGQGPQEFQFLLGYAGWSSGQIEKEMEANSWLHLPVDTDMIFHTPIDELWKSTTSNLGFDPSRISNQIGHA